MSLIPEPNIIKTTRIDDEPLRVKIGIRGIPTSLANGIRREILTNVRTVAMVSEPTEKSTIRIVENTSRLNNQFLALRISLLPVYIPPPNPTQGPDTIITDRYEVRLDVQAKSEDIEVTTRDLTIFDKKTSTFLSPSITWNVFPYDPIPIVPLRGPRGETPGEVLRFTAGLAVGGGKDHACFSPVSLVTYAMSLDAEQAKAAEDDEVTKEGVGGTEREEGFRKAFQNTTGLRYVLRNDVGDPVAFQFNIESEGQLDPVFIFKEGAIVLAKRLRAISTELRTLYKQRDSLTEDTKTIRSPRLELVTEGQDSDEFVIRFQDEDHTLGILLQDMVLRIAKQNDTKNYSKWFVGYRIPHPLTPVMVMRFHREGLDLKTLFEGFLFIALETAETACKQIITQLNDVEIEPHPSSGLIDSQFQRERLVPVAEVEDDDDDDGGDAGTGAAAASAAGAAD
jgi:DNA-directed RNA polymerase subunit L